MSRIRNLVTALGLTLASPSFAQDTGLDKSAYEEAIKIDLASIDTSEERIYGPAYLKTLVVYNYALVRMISKYGAAVDEIHKVATCEQYRSTLQNLMDSRKKVYQLEDTITELAPHLRGSNFILEGLARENKKSYDHAESVYSAAASDMNKKCSKED